RLQAVVLVHQVDVLAPRHGEPDVAAAGRRAGVVEVEDADVGPELGDRVQPPQGPVRGAVVREDELTLLRRQRLIEQRPQARAEVIVRQAGVRHRYDHADLHTHEAQGATRAAAARSGLPKGQANLTRVSTPLSTSLWPASGPTRRTACRTGRRCS